MLQPFLTNIAKSHSAEIMAFFDSGQPERAYTKADIKFVWYNSRLMLLISYAKVFIHKTKLLMADFW